ncbi:hypothetical protein NHX12_006606, partial [Muraenolepis orangiensis]
MVVEMLRSPGKHITLPPAKWAQGQTVFPWVYALMTQLRHEGWIHHLGHHAVACFLTGAELGMKVFEELALDGDYSSNTGSWMWTLLESTPWTLPPGLYLLDSTLDSTSWTLPPGLYPLDSTPWTLPPGLYLLDSTPWTLPPGLYPLDSTPWTLPPGLYPLDSTLDSTPWTLPPGL